VASSADIGKVKQPSPPAEYRIGWISLVAAAIGVLAGIIAYLLYDLIALCTNLAYYHVWSIHFRSPESTPFHYWILVIPMIGGLFTAFAAKYGSPKIKGHGIPETIEAVLTARSRINATVAILKPLSAAISIGTGGPFGAEGPIIQTGGAFGSLVGQLISTTAAERKVLLASGAAAGMAATFNTPIAGVILAIELLLFEFRARSFIPLVIASTLGTSTRVILLGQHSMFSIGDVNFDPLHGLPYYVLLGVICGGAAIGLTKLLYWVEDQFERLSPVIHEFWHPVIGSFAVGVIGFFVPRILGVGYDTISDILHDNLALKMVLLILIFKFAGLVISLGSGTSGGLLAPTFMWSAALGSVFAMVVDRIHPAAHLAPAAYALVAMAAVFGTAARATFALIVFAFEITGDYNAILPLMLACVIADLIGLRFLPRSIMTEKLARRGVSVPGEYEAVVLKMVRVGDVMRTDVPAIPADMSVAELAARMSGARRHAADEASPREPALNLIRGLPVVGKEGELVGIVTQGDVLRALENDPNGTAKVLEAGSSPPIVAYPDEIVFDALERMLQNDVGRLPVVSRDNPRKLVGFFNRSSILGAWTRQMEEEGVRERGWLARWRGSNVDSSVLE